LAHAKTNRSTKEKAGVLSDQTERETEAQGHTQGITDQKPLNPGIQNRSYRQGTDHAQNLRNEAPEKQSLMETPSFRFSAHHGVVPCPNRFPAADSIWEC
jgi:hypothetical protein